MVIPHVDLEAVKEWTKRTLTRERIVDVAISASTVAVVGMVLSVLYRAMQNQTITGF
jgi:uncharacterized membrane protein